MMAMIRDLARRREALVLRSGLQRAEIAAQLSPAARKLAAVDRVTATLRAHPVMAGVAATGLALIGPRRLLRWVMRVAPIYSLLSRI
jgi:hypothetical protein